MKKNNNFIIILAAFLIIALGVMGYVIFNQGQTQDLVDKATVSLGRQSSSDETDEIERDLKNTQLDNLDQELDSIEQELR